MPQNAGAWEAIIREALNAFPEVTPSDDIIRKLSTQLSARWEHSYMKTSVHCEVVLAVHFREKKKKYPKLNNPVQNIGVSKLSCKACSVFLMALNDSAKKGDPRFVTRGCHGKAYFPSGFPKLKLFPTDVTRSIQSNFVKGMAMVFALQLTTSSRPLSDSTTGSHPDDSESSSMLGDVDNIILYASEGVDGT
jgi:hypothetical protein